MADVINLLVETLCQQNTASECYQFISQYPDLIQQIMWLVFFPVVFLLVFVYLLTEGVTKTITGPKKKFQVIIAVALFLFIIFQGWYHYALNLSKFWYIALIIISGFFILIHRMGGGHSGGGGAPGGGGGGRRFARGAGSGAVLDYVGKRAMKKITGEEKDVVRDIESGLDVLKSMAKNIKRNRGKTDLRGFAALLTEFRAQDRYVVGKIDELKDIVKLGGFKIGSPELEEFEKRRLKILEGVSEDLAKDVKEMK